VKAGGTFAPLDLLLTPRPDPVREAPSVSQQSRLTSRQVMVLGHLQQGKANKIIAHELGMSESTVKVHVRNIMRKMGATNRTQAAYKAQNLWGAPALRR
jgi:DNA-binding NarL/FixJ family response regulator